MADTGRFLGGDSPQQPQKTRFGVRTDGTQKGMGFLGPLATPFGQSATEKSATVNIDGKELLIPLIVPTLSPIEVSELLGGLKPRQSTVEKAVAHARQRMGQGLSVFSD